MHSNDDTDPPDWDFTPEQREHFTWLLARDTEFELLQLQRDFESQPPWDEYDVDAAMNRLSCKYAMSRASLDGRLITAWLLRRYYRKLSPDYVRRRGLAV